MNETPTLSPPQPQPPPRRSESLKNLMAALGKVQVEMKPAAFDMTNPHYGKPYASLTSVYAASKALMDKYDLSVLQFVETIGNEQWVETHISHSASGEWLSSRMKLILSKQDMQGMGGAITYARRYTYSVLVGVVSEEDDDGNSASEGKKGKPQQSNHHKPNNSSHQKPPQQGKQMPPAQTKPKGPPGPALPPAQKPDPGAYVIPFGETVGIKGKRVDECNEQVLLDAITWSRGEMAKGPVHSSIKVFEQNAVAFLKEMGTDVPQQQTQRGN